MIINHVIKAILNNDTYFQIIGRLSFPLFCFGISVGILNTKNITKYMLRVFLIAIISQPAYSILVNNHKLNICFNFMSCICFLKLTKLLTDKDLGILKRIVAFLGLVIILLIILLEFVEYGILSLLLIYACIFYMKGRFIKSINILFFLNQYTYSLCL